MSQALFSERDPFGSISPYLEVGAYEVLWARRGASFKSMAALFAARPGALPSDLVDPAEAAAAAAEVVQRLRKAGVHGWGVRIHRAGEYPSKLRDARHPVELLYFAGTWELVEAPSVAVVGTRQPTPEGEARARRLVRELVADGWTIVSGLARGVDTAAHTAAIEAGGSTIAVIGTPLSEFYPRENEDLQRFIAARHLVVSQVPVKRYAMGGPRTNRLFFPERNVTMSALTSATIIVEASDTSGTLIQARAALHQGRKLFILDSCFSVSGLRWPHEFAKRGAVRVTSFEQIRDVIGTPILKAR